MRPTVRISGLTILVMCLVAATPRHIDFRVRNQGMDTHEVRVRDLNCRKALPEKCRLARDLLRSSDCRDNPGAAKCRRARNALGRAECEAGMIYTGTLKAGSSVSMAACNDGSRHAEVEIRLDRGAWTTYRWIDPDQTLELR